MFFRRKKNRLVGFAFDILKKRLFDSSQFKNLRTRAVETAEEVTYITFLAKEMEPDIDEVKFYSKKLEDEINSVKKSYERIFGVKLNSKN